MPKDNCLQQPNQSLMTFPDDICTLNWNPQLTRLDIAATAKQNRYAN